MQDLEGLYYELKPFLLLGLAIYAFVSPNPNMVGVASSLILLFAAGFILRKRMANRKGTGMETFIYEGAPYAYLALGVYALVSLRESRLAIASGLLLLFVAVLILRLRHKARNG